MQRRDIILSGLAFTVLPFAPLFAQVPDNAARFRFRAARSAVQVQVQALQPGTFASSSGAETGSAATA